MALKKPLRVPMGESLGSALKAAATMARGRGFVENTWETHFIDSRITSRKLIRRGKIIRAAANYYFLEL